MISAIDLVRLFIDKCVNLKSLRNKIDILYVFMYIYIPFSVPCNDCCKIYKRTFSILLDSVSLFCGLPSIRVFHLYVLEVYSSRYAIKHTLQYILCCMNIVLMVDFVHKAR